MSQDPAMVWEGKFSAQAGILTRHRNGFIRFVAAPDRFVAELFRHSIVWGH